MDGFPTSTKRTATAGMSSIQLPAGVAERLPFLKDERCVFFDFGLMLFPPPSYVAAGSTQPLPLERMTREPIVAVITEKGLVAATFPRATRPPRIIPHDHIAGVSKEAGDRICVHLTGDADVHLMLGKGDTFVVYLVDLQDRAMGRSMHFAQPSSSAGRGNRPTVDASSRGVEGQGDAEDSTVRQIGLTAAALHGAQAALEDNGCELGAIRFGRASRRTTRPPQELDEGSDASSVATIDHVIDDSADAGVAVDYPLVTIDGTSLRRRLFYFFQQYDRSKLPHLEELIRHHRGRETQLMQELQVQYGPEPNKSRWECRDQIAHQRRLRDQLTAQLKRARDELLLLSKEEALVAHAQRRVAAMTDQYVQRLRARYLASPQPPPSDAAANDGSNDLQLLRVTRLSTAPHGAGSSLGESDVGNGSSRVHETVAYWMAPEVFYAFVKEQAERAQGATLPPLCIVERVQHGAAVASPNNLAELRSSPSTGRGASNETFLCNWSFLAGWAQDFGAHSVAVLDKKSPTGVPSVRYVKSEQYWRGL